MTDAWVVILPIAAGVATVFGLLYIRKRWGHGDNDTDAGGGWSDSDGGGDGGD